jgi:hypothetical protein
MNRYVAQFVGRPACGLLTYHDLLVFAAAFIFFLLQPFGDFYMIIGDNICQVGYWRVLFHRHLVGSIGASTAKPGLIFFLGLFHDLSIWLFHSTVLIRVLLALFGALLVFITARMASETAGRVAGLMSAMYLLTCTPAPDFFASGSSMIFFLPTLFIGIWLFSRNHHYAGVFALCCAALFRIEALAVLAWLAISNQLCRRDWKHLTVSVVGGLVTAAVIVGVLYKLQGDLHRLNAGGPSAGYISHIFHNPSVVGRLEDSLGLIHKASLEVALRECGPPSFVMPALIALALHPSRRSYLAICGIPLFLILYLVFGGGNSQLRYFHFLIPALASLGTVGLYEAYQLGKPAARAKISPVVAITVLAAWFAWKVGPSNEGMWSVVLFIVVASLGFIARRPNATRLTTAFGPPLLASIAIGAIGVSLVKSRDRNRDLKPEDRYAVYTRDAFAVLRARPIPGGSRVLIDDDLIYGIVIQDPKYFSKVTSLQYFNIQDEASRKRILEETDYILASKWPYDYYYLHYDPLHVGQADAFRRSLEEAIDMNQSRIVYGRVLTPIENPRSWIVLKVEELE